ncbi:MAG: DUF448 domain-containing protein [Desulfuromonadales bacterium]
MAKRCKQPQRTCLGCRQVKDQSEMIRFVRSPEGEILVDLKGRLPGRGAYLCNSRDCMMAAVNRQQFNRAFRSECQPADLSTLTDRVARELLKHLASLLGMARKSANLVTGSNAVLDALTRKKTLSAIILAQDISPQIGDKIRRKAARQKILTAELFDKMELGRILGRAERSVVGVSDGKLAAAFMSDWHRYKDISGES